MYKDQTQLAAELAKKAHEGQTRWDGRPYIVHPEAIAKAVFQKHWGNYTDVTVTYAIAAAWLHDVIEDTAVTFGDLRVAGVKEEVITAVELLTKRDGEEYLTYLLRLKDNEIARIVKIEDIKNNMSDLDRKKKKSMYEKYTLALHILGA